MIQRSTEIKSRSEFAVLCNSRRLHLAVEVGTDCGDFACQFLSQWNGHRLWCVDPYEPYQHMNYDRISDLMFAVVRLAPYVPRVKIYRAPSVEAARKVNAPIPIGFVYIDGAHDPDSIAADIDAWWPRVASGGILAGHDFDSQVVRKAVESFAQGMTINVTQDSPPSWYVEKP